MVDVYIYSPCGLSGSLQTLEERTTTEGQHMGRTSRVAGKYYIPVIIKFPRVDLPADITC